MVRTLILALVLLLASTALHADEDVVSVPRSQLMALQEAHAAMAKLIDEQQRALRKAASGLLSCYANFQAYRDDPASSWQQGIR